MTGSQNEAGQTPGRPGVGPRLFVLAVESVACSVAVFLHGRFGRRYLGVRAAAVVPLVLLYACLWGGPDPRESPGPMFAFGVAYLAMCLRERVAGVVRRSQDRDGEHSLYDGTPFLLRVVPFAGEAAIKKLVEPAAVFVAGCLTAAVSAPLGLYLIVAAFCLMAVACLRDGWQRRRADDMTDAMIAQRQLAERVRGGGGNRG